MGALWHHSTYCTTVRTILSHSHVPYIVYITCFPRFPCWGYIFNIDCSPLTLRTYSSVHILSSDLHSLTLKLSSPSVWSEPQRKWIGESWSAVSYDSSLDMLDTVEWTPWSLDRWLLSFVQTFKGSTLIGTSATIILSANVGGGGTMFTHNLDKASGTNWWSSFPNIWYRSKSLSWRYNFYRKTLPVKVTLIYVRFIWSVFSMKYQLSNRSSKSRTP